ncbi:MAG: formate dehydrogenase accessory sulfurtransferase FdhD [Methanobacteriota archaeon]|nr:MAG: formate dehydrogenase accessory sulfurtransferase FdhD [Euryarchaeota archaeon]
MKRPGPTTRATVWKVRGERSSDETDLLAAEEPMEIRVETGASSKRATTSLSVTMRTPGHDFELAAGFLLTEGIVARKRDIVRIEYCTDSGVVQEYNIVSAVLRPDVAFRADRLSRHFYMTSSCGVCGKTSLEAVRVAARHPMPKGRPRINSDVVRSIPERLREEQALFSETGGLHAAGLFDARGNLQSVREDVGRHNAVDKVVGEAFLADRVPLSDHILAVSGRSSFEIMQKAAVAGVPIVVAVGAPSSLAVTLADEFGMTLVGFARGERFNVYAGRERIESGPPTTQE